MVSSWTVQATQHESFTKFNQKVEELTKEAGDVDIDNAFGEAINQLVIVAQQTH